MVASHDILDDIFYIPLLGFLCISKKCDVYWPIKPSDTRWNKKYVPRTKEESKMYCNQVHMLPISNKHSLECQKIMTKKSRISHDIYDGTKSFVKTDNFCVLSKKDKKNVSWKDLF